VQGVHRRPAVGQHVLGPGVAGVLLHLAVGVGLHDRRQALQVTGGLVLVVVFGLAGLVGVAHALVRASARQYDAGLVDVGHLVGVRGVGLGQSAPEGHGLRGGDVVAVGVRALAGRGHLVNPVGRLVGVLLAAGDERDTAVHRVWLAGHATSTGQAADGGGLGLLHVWPALRRAPLRVRRGV